MRTVVTLLLLLESLSFWGQSRAVLQDSLRTVMELLSSCPDSTDLQLRKAALNLELEQWSYAHEEYDRILRREPHNAAALYFRAYVNEKEGRYHFARLDYEQLLTLMPNHFETMIGLALLNQKDRRQTEAFDQLNRLVELYPDSALAFAARAGLEAERGMIELAEYDYTRALLLDATQTDYLGGRAEMRLQLGRLEDARDDLERMVALGVPRPSLRHLFDRCRRKR